MKKIKEIAENFNLYITVRRVEDSAHLMKYGTKSNKPISLGLIDGHYFLIEKVQVTKYALINFKELQERYTDDWNYKVKDGERIKSAKREIISSYDIVNPPPIGIFSAIISGSSSTIVANVVLS